VSTKKGKYGNPRKRTKLVGDLQKLVQPTGASNPRNFGGSIVSIGGSRDTGASFLDLTDIVLFESMEVCTVDAVRTGELQEQAIFMTMDGRVNKSKDRVHVGYMFGPDGAAAIITELLALSDRFGAELLNDVTRRLTELHQGGHVDIHFLKAAIDLVIEGKE